MPLDDFQNQVSDLLLRHRSLLDVMSKFQDSNARVNRSLTKAVTECRCIEVHTGKQTFPDDNLKEMAKTNLHTHMSGELCEHCREVVTEEIGKNLFYLTALCNLVDVPISNAIDKESKKLSTLGIFNLS
jgi:hypothetical protein